MLRVRPSPFGFFVFSRFLGRILTLEYYALAYSRRLTPSDEGGRPGTFPRAVGPQLSSARRPAGGGTRTLGNSPSLQWTCVTSATRRGSGFPGREPPFFRGSRSGGKPPATNPHRSEERRVGKEC